MTDGSRSFPERIAAVARHFEGVGVGCDIVAYTAAEWDQLCRDRRRIVDVVRSEGIVLASRREAGHDHGPSTAAPHSPAGSSGRS